jgi:hypothetical protein
VDEWPTVTLTWSPEAGEWSAVVVDDLTTFNGTLFSVLAEVESYVATLDN